MKIPRPRPRAPAENMLPVINVVFLLLIFFMLAGALRTPEPFDVDAPVARGESPAAGRDAVVLIARDGRLAFDGVETDARGLGEAVSARVARRPDLAVRLKADGRTPTPRVIEVMQRLRDAGVKRLRLLTVEPDP